MAKKKREKKIEEGVKNEPQYGIDYDEYHVHIMGFTSGGASFGITWDEAKNREGAIETKNVEDEFDFIQDDIEREDDYLDRNENSKEDETDDLPF